ncbi:uncharacterized protein SCHCODRAFT_02512163 [Schizophyllum commune H4-8]|uniref:MYND-type domain-containing protein n=1 Tax=Schizophyllum commune (strain H4-8 / FGSC 9210) TaxID=578458 RepID=D8QEQ2_SCHCM|nr:uncharacterized protein SCHCODRAFT_02512163 [Schizophyllum commune H4-8]KAI5888185.1 hypothetical protein SCHCODRAFT_02512163 [Schizophyllum commune H4-8]
MTETVSLSDLLTNIAPPGGACEFCLGKPSEAVPLQRCSSCRAKFYCSSRCQKKDWRTHKMNCSPLTLPLAPTIPKRSPDIIAEVKKVADLLQRIRDVCKLVLVMVSLAPALTQIIAYPTPSIGSQVSSIRSRLSSVSLTHSRDSSGSRPLRASRRT